MPPCDNGKHRVIYAIGIVAAMFLEGCASQDHAFTDTTSPPPEAAGQYPDWTKALSLPLLPFAGQSGGYSYSTGIR
jgi:hypothetical protein